MAPYPDEALTLGTELSRYKVCKSSLYGVTPPASEGQCPVSTATLVQSTACDPLLAILWCFNIAMVYGMC